MALGPPDDLLPFVVMAFGRFAPARVRVRYDPMPRPSTAELDAAIAAEWERQFAAVKGTDRILFDGPLLRYRAHAVATDAGGMGGIGDVFTLTVGPTCYRDFVGTNLYNRRRLTEFGWERFANPVGTTATLLTADGRICYGRRSSRVSYHAGHVHTFGGALEEGDRAPNGEIDAFGGVARELEEELGLSRGEIHDMVCVGLIRDNEIHQPEMLFEARLELTADELRGRWSAAEAKDEHDGLVDLGDAPDAVVPFIRSCGLIAPVAVGALMIHGRLRWGDDWFNRAARELRVVAR